MATVTEREVRLSGLAYLKAVTTLLQRARLQDPTAGLWEAADLQWWWRRPRSSDEVGQRVVIDEQDQPVATVALIDWDEQWAAEPMVLADRAADLLPGLWSRALDDLARRGPTTVETTVADDDPLMAELAGAAGFSSSAGYAETWMAARDRPSVGPPPDGYALSDRIVESDRPHHMIPRNGPDVGVRLAQTSLYRPDLDLCLRDSDGQLAAYALFWYDPVTSVGMLEPMRTEDAHQRRGLGGHVLHEGLARLAALGATRLKVSYELDNPASERLYLSSGFTARSTSATWRRGVDPG